MESLEELDEELARARDDVRRRIKLGRDIDSVSQALERETARWESLAAVLAEETEDVARLEGHGLRRWLASLAGSREERLTKERADVAGVKLRHDATARIVGGLRAELDRLRAEAATLAGADERFQAALDGKERLVARLAAGGTTLPVASRLAEVAGRRADAEADLRELGEAIRAGRSVQRELRALGEALGSARRVGILDVLGGGLLVTMVKHGYMDDARDVASGLQQKLLRFDRELADVRGAGLSADQIELGFGLRFADVVLDGLLADLVVQSRINRARQAVEDTAARVEATLGRLERLVAGAEETARAALAERRQLLTSPAPDAGEGRTGGR